MKIEGLWWRSGREGTLETTPPAKSTRPTSQLARRDESGTKSTCATLPHNPALSAGGRPGRPITSVSPNHAPWDAKLAMSGPYHSVQLITGHCTVLVTRKNGGGRRELIRLRTRFGFGGIQDMEALNLGSMSRKSVGPHGDSGREMTKMLNAATVSLS